MWACRYAYDRGEGAREEAAVEAKGARRPEELPPD
jgi:hypothetical protein